MDDVGLELVQEAQDPAHLRAPEGRQREVHAPDGIHAQAQVRPRLGDLARVHEHHVMSPGHLDGELEGQAALSSTELLLVRGYHEYFHAPKNDTAIRILPSNAGNVSLTSEPAPPIFPAGNARSEARNSPDVRTPSIAGESPPRHADGVRFHQSLRGHHRRVRPLPRFLHALREPFPLAPHARPVFRPRQLHRPVRRRSPLPRRSRRLRGGARPVVHALPDRPGKGQPGGIGRRGGPAGGLVVRDCRYPPVRGLAR